MLSDIWAWFNCDFVLNSLHHIMKNSIAPTSWSSTLWLQTTLTAHLKIGRETDNPTGTTTLYQHWYNCHTLTLKYGGNMVVFESCTDVVSK